MAVRSDDDRLSVPLVRQANERVGDADLVGDREALRLEAGLAGKGLAVLGGLLRPSRRNRSGWVRNALHPDQ
jgi:hypothetical protein